MRALIFLYFILLLPYYYGQSSYKKELNSHDSFLALESNPTVSKYSNIKSVKVLLDLDDQSVYFIDGKKYRLHYDFCKAVLGYRKSNYLFNEENYKSSSKREYILANINYLSTSKSYILEYNVSDNLSFEQIKSSYQIINTKIYDSTRVLLNNNDRLNLKDSLLAHKIPIIYPNDIFGMQKQQVVNTGRATGTLFLVKNEEQLFSTNLSDKILLLDVDLLDIPNCKAIITTQYQTPLSHISLLSKNRGIPVIAYPQAMEDSLIKQLVDSLVFFQVKPSGFNIKKERVSKESKSDKSLKKLSANLTTNSLKNIDEIKLDEKKTFGTKVAHLAQLEKVQNKTFRIPEGAFGIPFIYYHNHVNLDTTIAKKINAIVTNVEIKENRKRLQKELEELSDLIIQKPIDSSFLASVTTKIKEINISDRYRFRSSSNAEDIKGFNGAGLYTSKTGIVNDLDKTIEKAIKKVWASVWTLRAFEEREIFNIDHQTVYMGILAHRGFPNEKMNGVAITSNLYREYNAGFVLNQQVGEHRVVDNKDYLPEQLISYFNSKASFFMDKDAVEYISTSPLNDNKPILDSKEIYDLTIELEKVKKHFYRILPGKSYRKFALDIEYKIALDLNGKEQLYIKQARLLSSK